MNIRKKFKTIKCLYNWGTIYNLETDEKLNFKTKRVYCIASWAWVMTYQKSEKDIPEIIRIVFVD